MCQITHLLICGHICFYVFIGFFATYIYNDCSNLLRAVGNSVTPLIFLGVSVVLNIILDLYFVIGLGMGIMGAAVATVISQYVAGLGILTYYIIKYPEYRVRKEDFRWSKSNFKNILSLSGLHLYSAVSNESGHTYGSGNS